MDLQATNSRAHNETLIGSVQRVMIDAVDETGQLTGRTQAHAPEVDGVVYLHGAATEDGQANSGEFVNVTITKALDYDLIGEIQDG